MCGDCGLPFSRERHQIAETLQGGNAELSLYLAGELDARPHYLYLQGPGVRGLVLELDAHGDVQPLVHLGTAGDLEPAVEVVPFQSQVHVLGDALLAVVDNYLVDYGVGTGPEADQGCIGLGSCSRQLRRAWAPGSVPRCSGPSTPSMRTNGPVCLTEVMRLGYSTCIVVPCTQEVCSAIPSTSLSDRDFWSVQRPPVRGYCPNTSAPDSMDRRRRRDYIPWSQKRYRPKPAL